MRNQNLVNEWYCKHNIKFWFLYVKNWKKLNQTLKFNITDKIEVNTKTKN